MVKNMENIYESEFTKKRKAALKTHRNIMIEEIMIYVTAILMLVGNGSKLVVASSMQIPIISSGGLIKIGAIVEMLILTGIIFIPGPLIIMRDILAYYYNKDYW